MTILVRYDVVTALQAIAKYKIELLLGTVVGYRDLIEHPDFKKYDVSSVRVCLTGEWMIWITPEFSEKFKGVVGLPVVKWGYAGTEMCNVAIHGGRIGYEIPFKDQFMAGAVPPDEGIDVKIIDFDNRQELPFGRKGEIVIKTPARCKYYWNKPEETAKSLTLDGWFLSGDIGMLDDEGYLYWYGRKKYLIRVSGFQVSGAEIEMIGRNCPEISNIAVAGISHPKKGQIPLAFVQLATGSRATAEDIEKWFKEHVATYKVPTVKVIDKLPLTPKGSIDMKKLLTWMA